MLRQRRKELVEKAVETTKKFDAFFKLEDDYKETSSARGFTSLIVYLIIIVLVLLELNYYFDKRFVYSYEVDTDFSSKLKLNVDITVKMPCDLIGPDVIDSTSNEALTDQQINMENTWFEMSDNQKRNHKLISTIYEKIRNNYHALHSILWLSYGNIPSKLGPRETMPNHPPDACRIHGTYDLNKVAGTLHIVLGKSVTFLGNHAHVMNMFSANFPTNFSHRIDDFSFGENSHLVHNALNFDLKIAEAEHTNFNYFISIVPTQIHSMDKKDETYQYSVTENIRVIDHQHDTHGMPGIYFKYDISPLKVKAELKRMSLLELTINLIGIIGGIFSTSIMLNSFYQLFCDIIKSRNQK